MVGGRHGVLVELLAEVGWSVSRLAHEVNREVGAGYVSRTTVSEWVNCSRVPRQPLPTVVAHVLSQASGRVVSVGCLWPGTAGSAEWVSADVGTQVSWDLWGTKALVNGWFTSGGAMLGGDRRSFMALSGAALTVPAWQYVDRVKDVPDVGAFERALGGSGVSSPKVSAALVEYFQTLVGAFRRIDDLEGGSPENLKHVDNAIGQVNSYLKHGTFTSSDVAPKLLGVLAQMCQTGGWMAVDAESHGLAQRYYRMGLQAAHSAGDHDLGAVLLACMSYQAANRQQAHEASELGAAAMRVSRSAHPLVRTVVMARVAHAQAAAGDARGFRSSTQKSAELFERAQEVGGGPEYLYWLDSSMAETVAGQGVLLLTLRNARGAKSQLEEAERLLAAEVTQTGPDRPRDAYYHGAWLARAHVKRGDLYRGLSAAQGVVDGVGTISSPRTRRVLGDLDKDLANLRSDRNLREVRQLRKQMQAVLAA